MSFFDRHYPHWPPGVPKTLSIPRTSIYYNLEVSAARYPDRVTAAASFYGTWLVNDAEESPHLNLGKVKGELYIACAEHDELAPLPMVEELRGLFNRAGTAGEIELYPGVHHGFAFPSGRVYDKPAAERHWERLIALYRRRLG